MQLTILRWSSLLYTLAPIAALIATKAGKPGENRGTDRTFPSREQVSHAQQSDQGHGLMAKALPRLSYVLQEQSRHVELTTSCFVVRTGMSVYHVTTLVGPHRAKEIGLLATVTSIKSTVSHSISHSGEDANGALTNRAFLDLYPQLLLSDDHPSKERNGDSSSAAGRAQSPRFRAADLYVCIVGSRQTLIPSLWSQAILAKPQLSNAPAKNRLPGKRYGENSAVDCCA